MNQNECNHVILKKVAGPLHPSGKDYVCDGCGQFFRAEILVIEVKFGTKDKNDE